MNKEIILNKELNKYSKELKEDIKLNLENLKEKSLMSSSIWAKWLNYLFLEKENLDKLDLLKKKIIEKKLENPINSQSVLKLKSEDILKNSDKNLKKIKILEKQTNDSIDFIERALTIISNFGYNIKNTIEILRLQLK